MKIKHTLKNETMKLSHFNENHVIGEKNVFAVSVTTLSSRAQHCGFDFVQDCTPQKELPFLSGNQVDLEGQLQDVRKIVATMQVMFI
jgi:hypothetical protein